MAGVGFRNSLGEDQRVISTRKLSENPGDHRNLLFLTFSVFDIVHIQHNAH